MQRTANENVAGSRRICKRWSYGWSSSESIITKSESSCPITKSNIKGFSFSFLFFFILHFTRRYQWSFSFFVTFWTKQIIQRRVIIPQGHSFNEVKPFSAKLCLDGLLNTQISCCNRLFIFFLLFPRRYYWLMNYQSCVMSFFSIYQLFCHVCIHLWSIYLGLFIILSNSTFSVFI